MDRSEMERAYRRRERLTYPTVTLSSAALLAAAHFVWGAHLLFPLIGVAVLGGTLLIVGPARVFFPHAWNTFDAPRPSPALEEEARVLARRMDVRFAALRLTPKHSTYPLIEWRGRTAVANTALRDLPDDERRFALARALSLMPSAVQRFVKVAYNPLFYTAFFFWCIDQRPLAIVLGSTLVALLVIGLLRLPHRERKARAKAIQAAGSDAALAYWRRKREEGHPSARGEIALLEGSGAAPTLKAKS